MDFFFFSNTNIFNFALRTYRFSYIILTLPFPRFLNVIYVWATSNQSQEDAEKWVAQLELPLPGEPITAKSAQDELAQLSQFDLN